MNLYRLQNIITLKRIYRIHTFTILIQMDSKESEMRTISPEPLNHQNPEQTAQEPFQGRLPARHA
ncbi:MAG: hypothetical protein PHC28_16485, partial [Flavobacterium sp.]|uniref:hypothetical protein n=1 Tax=Flavobacterium sp. TaxID=239 RepID=UPI00262CF765